MRRGFFVSLAAVLLIGIILISVISTQEREEAQTELDLMSLENRLAANYIDVLTDVTIPREIAIAAKNEFDGANSINQLSNRVSSTATVKILNEYRELGLPFEDIVVSNIVVSNWRHVDAWTIELDYRFDLSAESSRGIAWNAPVQTGSLQFSVVGFEHPAFSSSGQIVREFWGVNASSPQNTNCFLREKVNSYNCGTTEQICPYAYPECRN